MDFTKKRELIFCHITDDIGTALDDLRYQFDSDTWREIFEKIIHYIHTHPVRNVNKCLLYELYGQH